MIRRVVDDSSKLKELSWACDLALIREVGLWHLCLWGEIMLESDSWCLLSWRGLELERFHRVHALYSLLEDNLILLR